MNDRDTLLLESVRVHRERLSSALVFGPPESRRAVGDNIRRFIGSIVVAAIVCAVCVAISFIGSVVAQQQEQAERSSAPIVQVHGEMAEGSA